MQKLKNKLSRLRKKRQGFTLVEILISTALMLVVMLVTSTIFFNTMGTSNHAVRRSERKLSADEIYIAITNRLSTATYVALQDANTPLNKLIYENFIKITDDNKVVFGTRSGGVSLSVTPAGLNDGNITLFSKKNSAANDENVLNLELSIKDAERHEGYSINSALEIYNITQKNKLKLKDPAPGYLNAFGIRDMTSAAGRSNDDHYTNIIISYEGGSGFITDETYGDGLYTVDQQYKDPAPPAGGAYPVFDKTKDQEFHKGDYVIGPDGNLYLAKEDIHYRANSNIGYPGEPDDFGQMWKHVGNDSYQHPSYYVPGDVICGSDGGYYMCYSYVYNIEWDPAAQDGSVTSYFVPVYWCQQAADIMADAIVPVPNTQASVVGPDGTIHRNSVSGRAYGWSLAPQIPGRNMAAHISNGFYTCAWTSLVGTPNVVPPELAGLNVPTDAEHMITNKNDIKRPG